MLWACILLPHLALDGVLRRRPPSDAPLVLVTGHAQARSVYAANASARAAGLRPGQRLAAAQAAGGRYLAGAVLLFHGRACRRHDIQQVAHKQKIPCQAAI